MLICFCKLLLALTLTTSLVSSLGIIDRRQSKVDKRFVAKQLSGESENKTEEISLESLAKLQLSQKIEDTQYEQEDIVEDQLETKSLSFGEDLTKLGKDQNWIPFGEADSIEKNCIRKVVDYYDVVEDEVIQCQKITENKCYTSQDTIFDTFTTEVCDDTYTKNCHISFVEETSPVNVKVCYTEASRVCQAEDLYKRKRSLDLKNYEEFVVKDNCIEAIETVCETFNRLHVVSDDYADCKVESLKICQRQTDCPKVPKTTCEIIKKNVTKEFPEQQCKKIKKRICGPEDCPIRLLPELCREEVKKASSKVPLEQCTLTPKQECRDVSILVPSLVPVEKCLNIPKEVCSKVKVPRKVKRCVTRLFCEGTPGLQYSGLDYTKLMVVGGLNSEGKPVDFEIVDLGARQSVCKKVPNLQIPHWNVVGGLGLSEVPIVCDLGISTSTSSKCYMLSNNVWVLTASLSENRLGANLLSFKNTSSNTNELVISGGSDQDDKTSVSSECFSSDGWKQAFPNFPVGIQGHCIVSLNNTQFMAIGGKQGIDKDISSTTFELKIGQGKPEWVQGPSMLKTRFDHHCGRIRKSEKSDDFNIVVVGGGDNSVEIFDTTTRVWNNGPSLPDNLTSGTTLVEDPKGGVVLVGGTVNNESGESVSNNIYRLSSSDRDWVKMHATLKYARERHAAFFVPDQLANCN